MRYHSRSLGQNNSPELLSIITPDFGVCMQSIQDDHDELSLWNEVLASDDLVLILGSNTKTGSGSFEPERFLECCINVFELL